MLSSFGFFFFISIIFDLAYCVAVEVMVTVFWDSIVKVWEFDW